MKALTCICVLSSLIILSASSSARAQDNSNLVEQSPEGEAFTVTMPPIASVTPRKYQSGAISVSGKLYTAKSGAALYRIWSLEDEARANSAPSATDQYLDACADLVWETMLRAERDKIENTRKRYSFMQYRRELQLGPTPGREYSIMMDIAQGVVHFYSTQNRIYVLIATAPAFLSAQEEQFLKSFTLANQKPADAADSALVLPDNRPIPYGDPNSAGRADNGTGTGSSNNNAAATPHAATAPASDGNNGVFGPRGVTQKARILFKQEPQYTESARKYRVSGTVFIKAVFSATGEVTDIQVVRKLPHGLTEAATVAARQIRFQPAQKDGHPVSQYIQIEYNFSLF